mmetsp:Transcript_40301/g.74594  ORF Transcript_40301/g.74594 Transcript_40301/m.74594 type:complete len:84 (+) Transcript_40301:348-599(+)
MLGMDVQSASGGGGDDGGDDGEDDGSCGRDDSGSGSGGIGGLSMGKEKGGYLLQMSTVKVSHPTEASAATFPLPERAIVVAVQ